MLNPGLSCAAPIMPPDKFESAMITKYGYDVYFTIAALCVVLIVLGLIFIEPKTLRFSLIVVALSFLAFTTYFFRDPERVIPKQEDAVIAPADGKIISIQQIHDEEYFHADVWKISIFMSPFNVHVNRNPISGTIRHTRYVQGEYFAAFEDKASEKNEQMIVGIQGKNQNVMLKQIAGFIARRIVCPLKPGDSVRAGERFGMIKFGSRVDVYVPLSVRLRVQLGDHTRAGETILGDGSGTALGKN